MPEAFIDADLGAMAEQRIAPTRSRSVVGLMNEFAKLSRAFRARDGAVDLLSLAKWLAGVSCRPLHASH